MYAIVWAQQVIGHPLTPIVKTRYTSHEWNSVHKGLCYSALPVEVTRLGMISVVSDGSALGGWRLLRVRIRPTIDHKIPQGGQR